MGKSVGLETGCICFYQCRREEVSLLTRILNLDFSSSCHQPHEIGSFPLRTLTLDLSLSTPAKTGIKLFPVSSYFYSISSSIPQNLCSWSTKSLWWRVWQLFLPYAIICLRVSREGTSIMPTLLDIELISWRFQVKM